MKARTMPIVSATALPAAPGANGLALLRLGFRRFYLRAVVFACLAARAGTIRTGEIVRAREGNAPIVECVSGDVNACRIATVCKLAWILIDGLDAPYERLNRYTLGDLMIGRNALAAVLMQQ